MNLICEQSLTVSAPNNDEAGTCRTRTRETKNTKGTVRLGPDCAHKYARRAVCDKLTAQATRDKDLDHFLMKQNAQTRARGCKTKESR
jgi:hypothetical protein